jgi:hypothetical protein
MEDSISKNLEFKAFIFITLAGAWLWLIQSFSKILFVQGKDINALAGFVFSYIIICGFLISYIIFYSLVNLGMMLLYSSVYQVEENLFKKSELETIYKKYAKVFFSWWPMALILILGLILLTIFCSKMEWYFVLPIFIIYSSVIMKRTFRKIYSICDLFKHLRGFGWSFFGYIFLFIISISIYASTK